MNRTNSNSITSILVAALNDKESDFSKSMRDLFSRRIHRKVSNEVEFYDSTHTPLLYEEMGGAEIDIIARVPGKHKPVMMIEVKANIGETLQNSQAEGGNYEITAETHEIPLVYIIPKNYIHKDRLPKNTKEKPKLKVKIITWEEIKKKINKKIKVSFDSQIDQFVEIISNDNILSCEEKKLLHDKDLLIKIYNFKKEKLEMIRAGLKRKKRKILDSQEDQWGIGYYYSTKKPKNDYFIGFNPYYSDDKFFALCIEETSKNTNLGDRKKNPLYFEDGYYFIPILNSNCIEGDEVVLEEIRNSFKEVSIQPEIKLYFSPFFSLKTKIGDDFYNIFEDCKGHYEINTEAYKTLLKSHNIN